MKKLLSKMFFLSNSARGMLFALTLFFVGSFLWWSLLHLLVVCKGGYITLFDPFILNVWGLGALLIIFYSLGQAVCALIQLVRILRRERRFEALWYLLPAGLCFAAGAVGFIRAFPPVRSLEELSCGLSDGKGSSIVNVNDWLGAGFPGLAPKYWAAVFLLSLVLIFFGVLLFTEVFAAAEKKKFRSVFGAATLTLWAIFALWYCTFLGLAMHESCEVSAVRATLERRFGRPLTAAGVEALYREGKVDAAFWERQKKLYDALPQVAIDDRKVDFVSIALPDRPSAETLAWYDNLCRENRAAIEKYESCFDRVPPLPEKRFEPGNLFNVELSELNVCRAFARMERNRLIRFLAAGDVDGAWACYLRIGNSCAMSEKEPFLIGSLMWLHIEGRRLDCIEKLLESRLLIDDKLDKLDADLAELERSIPRSQQLAMYAEATFELDIVRGLEEGLTKFSDRRGNPNRRPGAFAPYRWIFPQWWHHFALDKKALLSDFLAPDMVHAPSHLDNSPFLLRDMLSAALKHAGAQFYALTARARGMRALIRAEKYRREHGEFPKTLADLPLDPFTGKPLVYELGKVELCAIVWKKPVCFPEDEVKSAVDAVSVRSPAEELSNYSVRNPEKGTDRTRAVIRLR